MNNDLSIHQKHLDSYSFDTQCSFCIPEIVRLIKAGKVHDVITMNQIGRTLGAHVPHEAGTVPTDPMSPERATREATIILLDRLDATPCIINPWKSRDGNTASLHIYGNKKAPSTGPVHVLFISKTRIMAGEDCVGRETVPGLRIRTNAEGDRLGESHDCTTAREVTDTLERWADKTAQAIAEYVYS